MRGVVFTRITRIVPRKRKFGGVSGDDVEVDPLFTVAVHRPHNSCACRAKKCAPNRVHSPASHPADRHHRRKQRECTIVLVLYGTGIRNCTAIPAAETQEAVELLPTAPTAATLPSAATEPTPRPKLIPATSRAAESDPVG